MFENTKKGPVPNRGDRLWGLMEKKIQSFLQPGLQIRVFDKDNGKNENCQQLKDDRENGVDSFCGVGKPLADVREEVPNACHIKMTSFIFAPYFINIPKRDFDITQTKQSHRGL